jgi:hypothetical protein
MFGALGTEEIGGLMHTSRFRLLNRNCGSAAGFPVLSFATA